jgi:hypothetical protein
MAKEKGMATHEQPRRAWTVVLRRQPARIVDGHARGPYTDMFEIICCDCGDDPGLDYRDVPPHLQLTRGPYPLSDGVAAYNQHLGLHPKPAPSVDASSRRCTSVRPAPCSPDDWS